ncbi:hypothetical protein BVI2075_1020022 [Burkholderia vietnamiensis]|nr:hypothetical protein BVI2075_1020022 [Burkholderia vietnamiensis]
MIADCATRFFYTAKHSFVMADKLPFIRVQCGSYRRVPGVVLPAHARCGSGRTSYRPPHQELRCLMC